MAETKLNINKTFYITKVNSNEYKTNLFDPTKETVIKKDTDINFPTMHRIYMYLESQQSKQVGADTMNGVLQRMYSILKFTPEEIEERLPMHAATVVDDNNEVNLEALEACFAKLIDWFADFGVEISYRFVDTLLRTKNKKQYVLNYFKLSDHPAYNDIAAKITNSEFNQLMKNLNFVPTKPIVNTRLKIYFGPAGTGKTYKAQSEADYTILCSSDMSCKDMLQIFDFDDGKATFNKTDLWVAIEEGKTVLLDEINLLNHDTLQFLQGLTDGKPTIDFLGHKIKVHPDFKVIGTMNLIVNGMKFPLPEPLVDRCFEIDEYTLTAKDLIRTLV